jgi:hypothetical protein
MDSSRRMVLLALLLVLAKTIDPTLPLKIRGYLLILFMYANKFMAFLARKRRELMKMSGLSPNALLRALAKNLLPARQQSPKWINIPFLSFIRLMGKKFGDHNQQQHDDGDSTLALLGEIVDEVRRRAVQRLPAIFHCTADKLISINQYIIQPVYSQYKQLPYHDYILTAVVTATTLFTVRKYFKRVRNAAEVPLEWYGQNRRLKGWCVAVTDSDNIRFYHAPTVFHGPGAAEPRNRRLETINVRLAGIDAPEVRYIRYYTNNHS